MRKSKNSTGGRQTRRPASRKRLPRRKRFGQHFLAPAWAARVVDAIAPATGDVFLEVGPGTGALTFPLAETGAPILAVEIDSDLAAELTTRVPPHVTVLRGDVLDVDVLGFLAGLEPQRPPAGGSMPARRFRVVGNLPYNVATPIIFRLIDWHRSHRFFSDATVMVQHEVADRLLARVGTRNYGAMTIAASLHTRIERLLNLPPGAFTPKPKVRSTVVRLTFGEPSVRVGDEALFHRLVKAMFGQRRKMLANALKAFHPAAPAVLALADIDGRRRPETLQVAEIARLAELFASVDRPPML